MTPDELFALVDDGYTVTWLMVDGRYVVTATHPDRKADVGIGETPGEAWTMITERMAK